MGIYPVFSIGNAGPGSGTAGTPGNFPTVTGVGAVDSGDNIASFSSRGPAPNQSPWNDPAYWERADWNLNQPDISAPGVNVNSAAPGGGYQTMNGTSMASPHVTGAVALCLQKNPGLDYNTIYNILLDYSDHPAQGEPYPNNDYGWGRLNCYSALSAIPVGNVPNVVLRRASVVNDNNGNGKLDPGENAGIVCLVKNTGNQPATSVQGTLRTTSTWITINDSTYSYGNINPGDSTDNSADPFEVVAHASTPPGHVAQFQLELAAVETTWVRPFTLTVGLAPGTIIWGPENTTIPSTGFIYGLTYDYAGDRIYVLDAYSRTIRQYSSDSFVTYLAAINAPDTLCSDIAYSPYDDRLWVTGWNQKQVWKINKSTGAVLRQFANPANDYPVGLAYYNSSLWCADRRVSLGATQYLYVSDTMGSATQYNSPVQGYYNSRCLSFDSLGTSFVQVQTWFDASGLYLDSVGVVEYQGVPPTLTGNRFQLNPGWNIRGIAADPRDGNFWITIVQISGSYVNQVVKVKGFHQPELGIDETESSATTAAFEIYPNPVSSWVTARFQLRQGDRVSVKVYDVSGRLVRSVVNSQLFEAGPQELRWNLKDSNGSPVANGVYFMILETTDNSTAKKIIVTR